MKNDTLNSVFGSGYDVIGDIHGHGDELIALLIKLGYFHDGVSYTHKNRQVIFLGDFIDRGPQQRLVLQTVMAMCKRGSAQAIMGNHEFNALAYHTEHPDGSRKWLRTRNNKNTHQHLAFLNEYLSAPEELKSVLAWFMQLPLWLELEGELRLVHACWNESAMQRLKPLLNDDQTLTPQLLIDSSEPSRHEYTDVEILLKGMELKLPEGKPFKDKDGHSREEVRIKWWLTDATTYADVAMPPYVVKANPDLHNIELQKGDCPGYHSAVPVLFGHYWFSGEPAYVSPQGACLDYSVPLPSGKLVAYRWSGEQELRNDNFVSVTNMRVC